MGLEQKLSKRCAHQDPLCVRSDEISLPSPVHSPVQVAIESHAASNSTTSGGDAPEFASSKRIAHDLDVSIIRMRPFQSGCAKSPHSCALYPARDVRGGTL